MSHICYECVYTVVTQLNNVKLGTVQCNKTLSRSWPSWNIAVWAETKSKVPACWVTWCLMPLDSSAHTWSPFSRYSLILMSSACVFRVGVKCVVNFCNRKSICLYLEKIHNHLYSCDLRNVSVPNVNHVYFRMRTFMV